MGAISIHAPPRGATQRLCRHLSTWYFNSRPSARGDSAPCNASDYQFISIHAPPRGATSHREPGEVHHHISIHAPPRGATWLHMTRKTKRIISIHAPPRGATFGWLKHGNSAGNFNSRPSARGDAIQNFRQRRKKYFNSRPSARGDAIERDVSDDGKIISIHAPPRGATATIPSFFAARNFNSRPSARGDRKAGNQANASTISIHAPPRGATIRARMRSG